MPNTLNANGLTIKTRAEITTSLEAAYRSIYGSDINIDPDTPDGQKIQIFAQEIIDNLELLKSIYTSFDPDQAIGKVLNQRVAFNGISRRGGTFSETSIEIVTDRALNLDGLDQTSSPIYTVSDNDNNQWQLLNSQNIAAAGTYTFTFRAAVSGEVLATPNTIVNADTIVLGVTSINNPNVQSVIGIDEEKDVQLKERRRVSTSISNQGYIDGLKALLRNTEGVSFAEVYENNTSSTDSDGTPSHTIWVIVEGNYQDEDIADAIYRKRGAGSGMRGSVSFIVDQEDGSQFVINWDVVDVVEIFIEAELEGIGVDLNIDDYEQIIEEIPNQYIPQVFEQVNSNRLSSIIQSINSSALIESAGFSTSQDGPFPNILFPSDKTKRFTIPESNISLLPMLIEPMTPSVSQEEVMKFNAAGGFKPYSWAIPTNNSGGSVDAQGEYTAGTSDGTDTIRVTDDEGNFAETTVTVTS